MRETQERKEKGRGGKRGRETDSSELVVLSGGMVTFVNTYIRFNLRRNPVRTTVLGKFFLPVHHGACLAGLLALAPSYPFCVDSFISFDPYTYTNIHTRAHTADTQLRNARDPFRCKYEQTYSVHAEI